MVVLKLFLHSLYIFIRNFILGPVSYTHLLMLRVSTSAYREFLWLMSLPLLGEEAYRQRAKKRIRFFYKGSEEELTPDKLQPGQRLSIAMGEHIKTTLFAKENAQKIHWEGTVTALSGGIRLSMTAGYFDMKVPLNIEIYSFGAVSYTHLDVYKRQGRQCGYSKNRSKGKR